MNKIYLLIILVPLIFLLTGLITLKDYGINWDNTMHYNRGHSYLHYFLTGKENFLDLPKAALDESVDFKDIRGNYMPLFKNANRSTQTSEIINRSLFQSDVFNFEYFKEKDSGHPPINGIFAALSNYIFYQKLSLVSDLYSHQLFGILISALLILGVTIFVFLLFGIVPAIVAGSSLSLYPLFLGESHFNIKDPVLASSFGLTIIFFYLGVTKKNFKLLVLSALFAGLSIGTKFNALFLPLILGPWLLLYWGTIKKFKVRKKEIYALAVYVLIPVLVFYLTWPYLWFNGFEGLMNIFNYYQVEGIGSSDILTPYKFFGLNFFPIFWISITTPIPFLILSLVGIIWLVSKVIVKKDHSAFLILMWLLVPIMRVTMPNTVIYGGVRHIMEYIPALAVTVGAGAYYLLVKFRRLKLTIVYLLIFSITLVLVEVISIHPNENVYFNQLVGGLSGAREKNVPYWGNSFGNAYQQGITWLNKNAEINAKLGLPIGSTVNLPKENLRGDINLSNDSFSAFNREGEYQIEMSHNGVPKSTFTYSYLEKFLNPVYEQKVDGVVILKIWKNDLPHTKPGFDKEKQYEVNQIFRENSVLKLEITKEVNLTRLYISYDKENCSDQKNGSLSTSKDNNLWELQSDPLSYPQIKLENISIVNKDFVFLFAGAKAKYISISLADINSCLLKNQINIEVWGLDN